METDIVYMDETGDDGLKKGASEYFVLSSLLVKSDDWQTTFDEIKEFRRRLNDGISPPPLQGGH